MFRDDELKSVQPRRAWCATPVTRVARRGLASASRSRASVSAGFGAEGTGREDGGGSGRSASGAPTLESWPYHLRSFGPPSMTSSTASNRPFFLAWATVGAARRGVATGGDGGARRSRRDGGGAGRRGATRNDAERTRARRDDGGGHEEGGSSVDGVRRASVSYPHEASWAITRSAGAAAPGDRRGGCTAPFDWYRRQKKSRQRAPPPTFSPQRHFQRSDRRRRHSNRRSFPRGRRRAFDLAPASARRPAPKPVRGLARLFSAVAMKAKVKSHVQQARKLERSSSGKFAPAPRRGSKRPREAYVPKLPNPETGENPFAKQLANGDKDVRDATFAALAKSLGARGDVELRHESRKGRLFARMWSGAGRPGRARRTDGRPRAQTQAQGGSLLRRRLLHHRAPRVGRHRPSSHGQVSPPRATRHQPLPPVLRRPRLVRERRRGRRRVRHRTALVPGAHGEKGVVDAVGRQTSPRRALCPRTPESGGGRDSVEVGGDPEKDIEANGARASAAVFQRNHEER